MYVWLRDKDFFYSFCCYCCYICCMRRFFFVCFAFYLSSCHLSFAASDIIWCFDGFRSDCKTFQSRLIMIRFGHWTRIGNLNKLCYFAFKKRYLNFYFLQGILLTKGDIKVSKNIVLWGHIYEAKSFMRIMYYQKCNKRSRFFPLIHLFSFSFFVKKWTNVQGKINIDFLCQKENRKKFIIFSSSFFCETRFFLLIFFYP